MPEDWRFPRVGVSDMWNKWWIGDTVRGIPPLRMITPHRGGSTCQDWSPQVQTTSLKEDLQRLGIPDELHYMQGSTGW